MLRRARVTRTRFCSTKSSKTCVEVEQTLAGEAAPLARGGDVYGRRELAGVVLKGDGTFEFIYTESNGSVTSVSPSAGSTKEFSGEVDVWTRG